MLRGLKKPQFTEAQPTHVDLFVQNYDQLKGWAEYFSERDQELAGDLLHDTFIQFVLNKPDLKTIENVEGYLYTVMRNLHLSQMRRASRTPLRSLSVVEYDTVDVSLWASDFRDRIRMREELAAVCHYACIRKETAKAASVLILRFFHGYYPDEIALVVRSNRSAVEKRLKSARIEARTYLQNPDSLVFLSDPEPKIRPQLAGTLGEDLRFELRRQIFGSRRGECLKESALRELYHIDQVEELVDRQTIAHIVSCHTCLDTVNFELDLAPLASRYPLDTIGKDPGKKGGGDDDNGSGSTRGGSGAGGSKMFDSFQKRLDAHLHHQPEELCVSVNGQIQTYQKVVAGKGELTLILDTPENLGFIEIFSEQGLRLLMLNVEPPPVGDGRQTAHVALSDGRTIDANLSFGGPFPSLQITYDDPNGMPASTKIADLSIAASTSTEVVSNLETHGELQVSGRVAAGSESSASYKGKISAPRRRDGSFLKVLKSLLQPARLTTAVAVLLIVALIWFKFGPAPIVSAAELLQKSAAADEALLANKDRVLHRTLDFEEYGADRQIRTRKKIEVWQSSEKGIIARRIYDEQGRLTVGDWRSSNGIQTIYQDGAVAKPRPLPENIKRTTSFDDAWQLSLSAKEFMALLGGAKGAQFETRANDYVITYASESEPGAVAGGAFITQATITLSKDDFHAIEQTLTLLSGGETRTYRLTEAAYEWRPSSTVAPAVFEPNIELTGRAETRAVGSVPATVNTANTNLNKNSEFTASATVATPALEIEVIAALNNVGAFTGEQVDVSRSGEKIIVTALIENTNRKQELINALASVRNNPAVRIQIETVAEAEARQKRQTKNPRPNQQSETIEKFDAVDGTSPLNSQLRKRFSEDEARRFVGRVFNHSSEARSHALAIKQFSGRFSAADLASLTTAERTRWLALIRGHAEAFVQQAEALRRELQQVFPEATAGASGGGSNSSDREVQTSARELYDVSVGIDRSLNRSLAITPGIVGGAALDSAFWRQLADAVRIAKFLAAAK